MVFELIVVACDEFHSAEYLYFVPLFNLTDLLRDLQVYSLLFINMILIKTGVDF